MQTSSLYVYMSVDQLAPVRPMFDARSVASTAEAPDARCACAIHESAPPRPGSDAEGSAPHNLLRDVRTEVSW